jgi:TonB family protein
MTPIAKELETTPAATSASVSTNNAIKKPQQSAGRPQPVPLEVAVTVNGARTIEGTDKREPFSESTKTVLVFANGAVIRLTSTVAPGQLLFITNEKSKKEVVCQVVKSRNDGKSTGYVELEFTEPALGFWGVRIPAETALMPPSASPKPPIATRPVVPSAGSPSVVASLPPRNVVPNAVPKVAQPVAQVVATPKIAEAVPPAPVAPKQATPVVLPTKPPVVAPSIDAAAALKAEIVAKSLNSIVAPLSQSVPKPTETFEVPARVASPGNEISSEDLRQQAARLQEQLNALLFREAAAEKALSTPPVVALSPSAEETTAPSGAARQIVELAETAAKPLATVEAAKMVTLPPVPVEAKQPSMVSKSSSISLPVEEVKIPSWLAPLARETQDAAAEPERAEVSLPSDVKVHDTDLEALPLADLEATSHKSETVVFGGQLLGGESTTEVSSAGSKKGLFLGLAAAAALLIGGGIWYGRQPGNFLATPTSPSPIAESNKEQVNGSVARSDSNASAAGANSSFAPPTVSVNQAATIKPANVPPVNASPAVSTGATARTENSATHNTPPVPEPKKPALGDVRLATPNVNRSETSDGGEGAPSIDTVQGSSSADPMVGIAAPSNGPSAPMPIGGDVKPAHLLKSTPPIYPATAKSQRVSGDVKIDALIDASGVVTSTKVLSGPTMLHQAAITAVKQWQYEAAQLDGKPTSMHLTVTVQFRLQ